TRQSYSLGNSRWVSEHRRSSRTSRKITPETGFAYMANSVRPLPQPAGICKFQALAHHVSHLGGVPVADIADITFPRVEDPFNRRLPVGIYLGGVNADGSHPFYQCVFLGGLFLDGYLLDAVDDVLVKPCPSGDIIAGEFAPGLLPKLLTGLV